MIHIKSVMQAFAACSIVLISGCSTVKPYQKIYLNDEDMILSAKMVEQSEQDFESYREGASGANGGKVGAGCGCN
jgi:Domain of unknown function (DUF4266)